MSILKKIDFKAKAQKRIKVGKWEKVEKFDLGRN
jgi:hypothetical protein